MSWKDKIKEILYLIFLGLMLFITFCIGFFIIHSLIILKLSAGG
jgi:hypothetical protein